jgi:hypothetical protein
VKGPRTRRWQLHRPLLADGHGAVMARRLKLPPRPAIHRNMEHACISPFTHGPGWCTGAIIREYTRPSILYDMHRAESIR